MAVNFQLLNKETKEPVGLVEVDERICREIYKEEPHERWWGGTTFNWYDSIGFQLACGLTLEDGENSVRQHYRSSEIWREELPIIEKVIDFLQENYTTKNWVSIGR